MLAAHVVLTWDSKRFLYRKFGDLDLWENTFLTPQRHFYTSTKSKTNEFCNSFGTDGTGVLGPSRRETPKV